MTTSLQLGPADAPNLPDALEAAPDGATVSLAAGRYPLSRTITLTRSITIKGDAAGGGTVLDGEGRHALVNLLGEGRTYELHDLTFARGSGENGGALLAPQLNKVLVYGCTFLENKSSRDGSAVLLRCGSATFERCVFLRNVTEMSGALDVGRGQQATVDRCLFVDNLADAGAGIFLNDNGMLLLQSSTFVGNRAKRKRGGGGLFVFGSGDSGPSAMVVNTVFAGEEIINSDPSKQYDVRFDYSVVPTDLFTQKHFKNLGNNTIGSPKLIELAPRMFALTADSPGAGTALLSRIAHGAVDLFGRDLVRGGKADPGALARP